MLSAVLAFVLGVCAVHAFPVPPPPAAAIGMTAALLWFRRTYWACAAAGVALAAMAAHSVLADRWPVDRDRTDVLVTGTVITIPDRQQRGARFILRPDRALHPELPRRIRVAWYLDTSPPAGGTTWEMALRLRAPRGSLNPAAFDYERWLAARRIGATAVVRSHPPPRPIAGAPVHRMAAVRARIDQGLSDALPHHPRRAIVRGLALGERGELGAHEWETFARTGTAHLMAISGLHVGMVAGLAFALAGTVARRVLPDGAREIGAGAGLVAAATYAALAGFAVPTRRALFMLAAAAVQLCTRRHAVTLGAWSAALLLVVASDPLSPLTIGFWLSFAAVAFIAWRVAGRRRRPPWLLQLVRVQWAVSLGLAPLTLWFFQRGSLVAPLANLVAVPLFTAVIVPATLAGAALATLVPAVGAHWLAAVASALDASWAVLEVMSAWPWAQRFGAKPPGWALAAALSGAVVLLAPRGWPARAVTGIGLCLPMLCWAPPQVPHGGWKLTLLDVGQGLSAVVRTREHVLVYDAGPSFGPAADAGARIVVPYLRAHGIDALDKVVVSHPHDDHQGGVRSILGALPVRQLVAGDPAPLSSPATRCIAGDRWSWDGVDFRMLHPDGSTPANPNLVSCVLEVDAPGGRLLLTGDIEWPSELVLARPRSPLRRVDVVVVPHHGSATSSIPRFVARTAPRWALVPAGFGNRWDFPDEGVVRRWTDAGAVVQVAGMDGAITVVADPARGIQAPVLERAQQRRWWRVE